MKEFSILTDLLTRDAAAGAFWGSSGGLAASIVLGVRVMEMAGRIAVGGIVAAVAAPYLAVEVLKISPTSAVYPAICCALGVLGYQIVHAAINNPESIPLVGRLIPRLERAQGGGNASGKHPPSAQRKAPHGAAGADSGNPQVPPPVPRRVTAPTVT